MVGLVPLHKNNLFNGNIRDVATRLTDTISHMNCYRVGLLFVATIKTFAYTQCNIENTTGIHGSFIMAENFQMDSYFFIEYVKLEMRYWSHELGGFT